MFEQLICVKIVSGRNRGNKNRGKIMAVPRVRNSALIPSKIKNFSAVAPNGKRYEAPPVLTPRNIWLKPYNHPNFSGYTLLSQLLILFIVTGIVAKRSRFSGMRDIA